MVHVADMFVSFLMTVVILDDHVEVFLEGIVRIMATSVYTNARIYILATGKDSFFESESMFIF